GRLSSRRLESSEWEGLHRAELVHCGLKLGRRDRHEDSGEPLTRLARSQWRLDLEQPATDVLDLLPGVGEAFAKVGGLLFEAGDAGANPTEFVVGHEAARRVTVTRSWAGHQCSRRV